MVGGRGSIFDVIRNILCEKESLGRDVRSRRHQPKSL